MHRLILSAGGRRWLLSVLMGCLLMACGGEDPPAQTTAREIPPASHEFLDLRPSSGDVLVPPRIGLRWRYVPIQSDSLANVAAEPGSLVAATDTSRVVFRVQIVDSLETPYVRTETAKSEIRVTLPPETPPGDYSWWVESRAEGDTTIIAASERQSFRIE